MLSTLHEFSPFLSFTFFYFGHAEYGILVAQPGIELMPAAVEAWNLNHSVTREIPEFSLLILTTNL